MTARNRIRQWFKRENREENIQRGREMLEDTAKRQGQALAPLLKPENTGDVLKRLNMTGLDDLYAAIGFGGISSSQVLHKLADQYRKTAKAEALAEQLASAPAAQPSQPKSKPLPVNGIIVHGDPGMAVRFGNCCNPLPGDAIIGYITRGRGVSVHRADCTNAENLCKDPDRIIDVEWAIGAETSFPASLQIHAEDRAGTLLEISALLSGMNISIQGLNGKPTGDGKYVVDMTFSVGNAGQLDQIIRSLKHLKCVNEVYRVHR